jgi:hypothetical protein
MLARHSREPKDARSSGRISPCGAFGAGRGEALAQFRRPVSEGLRSSMSFLGLFAEYQ